MILGGFMSDTTLFDLAIVGAGVGGYVAAIRAAQLGLSVTIIEKRATLGGTCLNVGCIPSKALLESSEVYFEAGHTFQKHGLIFENLSFDLPTMLLRKEQIVKQLTDGVALLMKHNKVKVMAGTAKLLSQAALAVSLNDGTLATIEAKNILLASGSVPVQIPFLPFDGETVVSSDEALAFKKVPESLIVVGGGAIGLELGSVWHRLGSKVTVVELLPEILPGVDGQVAKTLNRLLKRQKMEILTGTKVTGLEKTANGANLKAIDAKGKELSLSAEKILVAVGRRPFYEGLGLETLGIVIDEKTRRIQIDDHFRTNVPNIYAVGDLVRGPMLAHKAEEEGVAVAEILAGQAGHVNQEVIPAVVYTAPEVAAVGQTEEQLKAVGREYKTGSFQFRANGRAMSKLAIDGFVKILADAKTDRLLGVHMIGAGVAELIAEAVSVMEFGGSAEDIARTIHAHPTMSEAVKEAALAVDNRAIHGF
jgi:dihydrolipoamide dehydrogenase